ncbi:MAG: glycerol-3-phosphate dehydrogenase [Candidatus Omnitrophota bacterium]
MNENLSQQFNQEFDLLIIGGGINGAAIANMAAGCNLKVALIEKNDFAAGTSSKSTKLVHGGIRYLENLELDLVYESLHERFRQVQCAPHLVKPIPFLIPVYKNDARPLWMMKLGVFLYDALAGRFTLGKHKTLSVGETELLEPSLNKENLLGSVMYYDAQMDDARLCLENILEAKRKGAIVANYTEAAAFLKENDKIVGVRARNSFNHDSFDIRAKKIISATGPWSNSLIRLDKTHEKKRVRTTKGVHIVYKGKLVNTAILITSHSDKRIFFAIPFLNNTLIGTTDTDYIGNPDKVTVNEKDIAYLMNEAKRVLPGLEFKNENILTSFAGLRPLVRSGGVLPSKATRKHDIFTTPSGVTFVIGGKYTTYRAIAEDCLKRVLKIRSKEEFRVYGSGVVIEKPEEIAKKFRIELESAQALVNKYGTRYKDVLKLTETNSSLKERFCSCNPFIKAQVIYSIKNELAQTPEDIIERRLGLCFYQCATKDCEKFIHHFTHSNGRY